MSRMRIPGLPSEPPNRGRGGPPDDLDGRPPGPGEFHIVPTIITLLVVVALAGLIYFWFFVRVVVGPGEALVLLKKNGSRSLEGDQIIIPGPPDRQTDPQGYAQWQRAIADFNGIIEKPEKPGTYFGYGPISYERHIVKIQQVPANKLGIVVRKFGDPLPPGQVLAGPGQRGPLPGFLTPGQYPDYSNPFAYEVKLVDPIQIDPGHRGVVTIMAGPLPRDPNRYLVDNGEQGVQASTEPEGFLYANPYERRVIPISIRSQRFEMAGADAIRFPSSDSFEIRMEGFVEWAVNPQTLPLAYVQYAEGSGLLEFLEERVILPYSRAFSRIVGSQYTARDFISGQTRIEFQSEFKRLLSEKCAEQGIEIRQALVRDIIPPDAIKDLINDREIARQQIRALEQQIAVARSQAELTRQTEIGLQNQAIGDANKKVVSIVMRAEQEKNVAVTRAQQELAVARLRLEAAQQLAEAQVARGKAEAEVILLQKQAEAEPLRQQVAAFGDGHAFAQYYFNQQVAPAIKSILTSTDGPFADLFRQFTSPRGTAPGTQIETTVEVRP